ncbi:MAG TPA: SprT family zinc-dependent metalloprotease [Dehalococcoidia bacterium]|nr:SprT family zinc-dependent metalloprotease [Dehalococcoidia bacterium]
MTTREARRRIATSRGPIEYVVRRSPRRRKTIEIAIEPPARVRVSAPLATKDADIDALVRQRADWIVRKLETLRNGGERQWRTGEVVSFLGREYPLYVVDGPRSSLPAVRLSGGRLEVRVPSSADESTRRLRAAVAVEWWYRQQAERHLRERIAHFAARLGVAPRAVLIRAQRRRWGSCSANGVLRFNWRIMMAPPDVVDYVVVHELCHLAHPHHQASFWAAVASALPDYRERKKALRAQGPAYALE